MGFDCGIEILRRGAGWWFGSVGGRDVVVVLGLGLWMLDAALLRAWDCY